MSNLLPSDINKNLHQVLMRAEDKHLNKLVENGRNGIALNKNLLITTGFGTLATLSTLVFAPVTGAAILPVAAPLLIAGLVGTSVVGKYNKYQAKKEQEKVVKEFCEIEGIDYQSTLDSFSTTTGYKSSFLNKVVNENHIKATATPIEINNTINTHADNSTQETLQTIKKQSKSFIKPSHINKTVCDIIYELSNENRKHLVDKFDGSSLPAMDKRAFLGTSVFTFGSLGGIIAAPAVFGPLMPAIAVIGMTGLVGGLVLGQYHKFKSNKAIRNFVNEFCQKSGLDPLVYEDSFSPTQYRGALLNKVINENHIDAKMKPEEVKQSIEKSSEQANNSLFEKVKESLPAFDITSKIRNSAAAFIKGYKAAKEELNNTPPRAPKI